MIKNILMVKENSDKDFLEFIVKSLVDNPDSVEIERKVDEMGVLLTLRVHADDMGQIIGKGGSTAKAIRDLVRTIGLKRKARINLKIAEPEGSTYKPREDSSDDRKEGLEDIKL
jgi:uncharacterized protein